jgi:5-formyltetrahydrofolate cyclo-ligase
MPEADRRAASDVIADRTIAILRARVGTGTIALYAAKGSEVDTARLDALARTAGFAVAYPRITPNDDSRALAFHLVEPRELIAARFGLREPHAIDHATVPTADLAAFVIPGLAFDRNGGRIGWGRGHYDATLAAADPRALRIGLAFDCQLVDAVPRDPHDAALQLIITERDIIEA